MLYIRYLDESGQEIIDTQTSLKELLTLAPPQRGRELQFFQRNCVVFENGEYRSLTREEAGEIVKEYSHLLKD